MLLAADTNILLDLALETEAVLDALETLRERIPKIRLVVPPTVLHELACAVKSGETAKKRNAAFTALSRLREWGFEPLNLVPVGHGIVERIADALRNKGLIPATEMNDSLIAAEAALLGCGILLSTDGHLRGIDFQRFKLLLQDFHVAAPIIATPREIVRKFCR
jgi:predicted nucleic acid-binding protein